MINKILGYEIATSNRAKCHSCYRKITKGTPRLIFTIDWTKRIKDKGTNEMVKWTLPIKRCICFKCTEKHLDWDIETQKKEIKRLRKIKRQFKYKMNNEKIKELISNSEIMEALEKE